MRISVSTFLHREVRYFPHLTHVPVAALSEGKILERAFDLRFILSGSVATTQANVAIMNTSYYAFLSGVFFLQRYLVTNQNSFPV